MNAWRMTAFPTTALVPKPAVFCRCLKKCKEMSEPILSPEITLLTRSGVVKPRRSIKMVFKLSYLERPSRLMRPRLRVLRRLNYIARYRRGSDEDRTEFQSG